MSLATITRIRTLAPWRASSDRPVPSTLPLYPADLAREDQRETKIWDALPVLPERDAELAKLTTVGAWFIYAPWMHMVWAWHYVAVVHLRPVAGMPPPHLATPQSTHEFIAYALDPTTEVIAEALRPLQPISIVQQFDAAHDAHARLIVEDLLEQVAKGRISVDSDFRAVWRHQLCECDERAAPP